MSDCYFGFYKSIIIISIIYFIGEFIITLSSLIPLGGPRFVFYIIVNLLKIILIKIKFN